jgi:hypothetical protein
MDQRLDGSFEYTGRTDLWYDEQKTQADDQGRIRLICDNGHEWHSAVEGLDKSREAL